MKKTYYFSHDYGARKDPKLVKLMMCEGHAGKGIYWDIIEMMYEEGGYLLLSEIPTYAFELRTECDRIANVLHSYDLFKNDGEKVWSESVLRRLKLREEKSTKAAESAAKRWKNNAENKQVNANALRSHCDGNAIKERKGKESKVNENKDYNDTEKKKAEKTNFVIPAGFETAVETWLKYKSEKNQRYKETGLRAMIKSLVNMSNNNPEMAIKIVEHSMSNNYDGLFPPKNNQPQQQRSGSGLMDIDCTVPY